MASSSARRGSGGTRIFGSLAAAAVTASVLAAPHDSPRPAGADPQTPAPTPAFGCDSTTATVGRTRMIAFTLAAPATEDQALQATAANPSILEVVRQPAVVQGASTGFLRIRGLKPGETTLAVATGSLKVRVSEPDPRQRLVETRPTITGPASGAAVWGAFAVGVELDVADTGMDTPPLRLHLSTGAVIAPSSDLSPRQALGDPTRRLVFLVDADPLPPGPLELALIADDAANSSESLSDPVTVRIIHPNQSDLTAGEAEATYDLQRPERFKRAPAKQNIGADPAASGGRFLNNGSAEPALCFPIHVEQPGWYQVMLTAAGDMAGGALPTVGLVIDGDRNPATNCRLAAAAWHRLALGIPVHLDAGDHVVTPLFTNDFYVGKLPGGKAVDRNLRLDRIEVAHLAGPSPSTSPGASGDSMAMTAMQPAASGAPPAPAAAEPSMTMMAQAGDASADAGPGMCLPDDPMGIAPSPMHIALYRPLDGLPLTGELDLEAQVWMDGIEKAAPETYRPPAVTLLFNGESLGVQHSVAPRFVIDPSHFRTGDNTIELVARADSGAIARTPVQTVRWSPPPSWPTEPARRFLRYTIHDPRWEPTTRQHFSKDGNPKERFAAAFLSNGELALTLPDDLAGPFDIFLEARGQDYKGPAIATVTLRIPGAAEPTPVGELKVPAGRYDTRPVGAKAITLKPGPKQLVVAFENDLYDAPGADGKGGGDRNFWLQAVILHSPPSPDHTPPAAAILYPKPDQSVYMADAVVATAADNRTLGSVELVVDDAPTRLKLDAGRKPGQFVFPLLARTLSPGQHTLAVRATDVAGNSTTSDPRPFTVLAAAPDHPTAYDRAIRLLDRFAFGPDPAELAAILTMGEDPWLYDRLGRSFDDPGEQAALGTAIFQYPGRGGGDVPRRALLHAILTPNPVRARFVLWTENHFSTWIRKTEGPRKWSEHIAFSRLGAAPFEELLLTSARSPAMLRYLDQENSYAAKLNENYAREIMELHTLGVHGGYTQQDVSNLAHLLTGWTTSREGDGRSGGEMALYSFRFDPALNDRAPTRIIGIDFPAALPPGGPAASESPDGAIDSHDRIHMALEALSAHPSTAQFVSRKLAEHYVAYPAPDALVSDLALVHQATGGDMRELLHAIARHPAFWAPADPAAKPALPAERLAHPLDYALRLSRTARRGYIGPTAEYLSRSGTGLFDRPTPDGYPEADSAYTDSNAMVQRWKLAQDLSGDLAALVADLARQEPATDFVGPPSPDAESLWAQRIVDSLAIHLTGHVLSDASNRAALDMLAAIPGKHAERIQKFAPLIAQLPEASLR